MIRFLNSLFALTLAAPSLLAQEDRPAPAFIALGDSITKGVRGGVTAEQTFAAILAEKLGETVLNVGIGGERTDQALQRVDASVIAAKPKYVLVMYGTNDSYIDQGKNESRITVEAYRQNLLAIVEKLRGQGIEPVLMTEPRWADDAKTNGIGENPNTALEAYVAACREVAAQKKVALVDHFSHWSKAVMSGHDLNEWTTDGCHPNPAGHVEIAKLALPVLRQLIATANVKPVEFSAMGCGPYTPEAEIALSRFMVLENANPTSAFIIHCGDIVTGKVKDWPESQYEKVAGILSNGNRIPTFIVPGDNEWNDQEDPDRHWGYWEKHFMGFDKKWKLPAGASAIDRQSERPENFAFLLDGVLFIGINKVGGMVHDPSEWEVRLKQNAEWISAQFTKHVADSHAAVIFAQASAISTIGSFDKSLATAAVVYEKPILYLHADGHKWTVEPGKWAPNITRVQLDVVNADFPPIQVRVTGRPGEPFSFDRRRDDPRWNVSP